MLLTLEDLWPHKLYRNAAAAAPPTEKVNLRQQTNDQEYILRYFPF